MAEIPLSPDGFFSLNPELEKNIYLANKGVFDHAYQLNHLCHQLKERFLPKNIDGQKVIAVAVFIKILNGFQAIVLLAQKGLRVEAEILLRTILEALFILRILCDDDQFHKKYISMDALRRKNLINVVRANNYEVFEATRTIMTDEFLNDLEKEVKESGVAHAESKAETLSKKAKLHELYVSVYKLTSEPVHTQIRSLTNYLKSDEKGNVVSFYDGPIADVSGEIDTAITILLASVEALQRLYKMEDLPEIKKLITDVINRRKSKKDEVSDGTK